MGSKWILMLTLLVLLSLQCGLSLGEQLDNELTAGRRLRRQVTVNPATTVLTVGYWVYVVAGVLGYCIICFIPCIIIGVCICCIAACASNRKPTQFQTTTTTTTNPPYGTPPPNVYPGVAPPVQPYSGQPDLYKQASAAYPPELPHGTQHGTEPPK